MKVIRIRLKSLHNEEWFEFFIEFKKLAESFGKDRIALGELYSLFETLLGKADKLLIVLRKSVYTQKMKLADKKRDDLFRGFYAVVKGMMKLSDNNKREAAKRLNNLLRGYRKLILKGSYAEESGSLHSLLQNLNEETYSADISLLEITEWVSTIELSEKEFLVFLRERTMEKADKPKEDLRQVRNRISTLYNAMISMLDAHLLGAGLDGNLAVDTKDDEFQGDVIYNFVISWNETVKKYRNSLAQRAGRRARSAGNGVAES
jgi:hypothetical protein